MARKIFLTLGGLIVCLVGSFLVWRYIGYKHDKDRNKRFLLPRVELSKIEINSITSEKMEMTANILIKNQIPISFKADSLQYRIFIGGKEVMKDYYKRSIDLKSNDTSLILLPITIFNHDLGSVLKANEREHNDSVEYRFQVSFYTNLIFRKQFKIDIKKYLPLIHIPEIKTDRIEIKTLNFARADIQLHLSIENQNTFPLKAKDLAYQLAIEDNKLIKGTIPGLTDIKAKSETELTIPFTISFKEVGKTLFNLLKKGSNVKYKLHLLFRIESDDKLVKNSKVVIESAGSLKSILKTAKNKPNSKSKISGREGF
jgi:LEA14-like dessication related protein